MKTFTRATSKLKGVAFALSLLASMAVNGQSVFSIVGNGTTFNTTTSYPAPYGNYWWGARHQLFVPASELLAAGVSPTVFIKSLGFTVGTSNGTNHVGWTITVY